MIEPMTADYRHRSGRRQERFATPPSAAPTLRGAEVATDAVSGRLGEDVQREASLVE